MTASHRRRAGQVLVIFVASAAVFIGMCAIVVDVAWYWASNLRIQRAADAAALAGVVHLPGNPTLAVSVARAEATKNGYTTTPGGYTVTPVPDPANPRRLEVTINGPVGTHFAKLFGLDHLPASRTSKAEYVLPVPMGSPENYYGTFGTLRTPAGGIVTNADSGPIAAGLPLVAPTGSWQVFTTTPPPPAPTDEWRFSDDRYLVRNSNTNPFQGFGSFGIPSLPAGATIRGIEVLLEARSSDNSGCELGVEISRNGGSSWTSTGIDEDLDNTDRVISFPSSGASTELWGLSNWNSGHLSDANFQVRVEYRDFNSGATCTNGSTAFLDWVRVRVHYTTLQPDVRITDPYGGPVNARGFWGTMHGPGAEDIDGDAYLPRYETRTSTLNPEYNATSYYDYAIELPAGATSGEVWVYDPVFCATASSGGFGTGDRYFSGSAATSAIYELYDTRSTPYDLGDDVLIATSGNLFRGIAASDTTLNGPSGMTSCAQGATNNKADGRYWHNRWWPIVGNADAPCRSDQAPCSRAGISAGALTTTYRLRTRSTDPSSNNSDSHNSFAIWARATTGGSVKVHGIGAMEAFTPLDPAQDAVAEFYLAQIDAIHAGKTVAIRLWDPGDTNQLVADLQILVPTDPDGAAGPAAPIYQAATFRWRSEWGTTNGNRAACNNRSGSGVNSVRTNTGGSVGVFNGCWLTIEIPIPVTYEAPRPAGEPEPGWWKIRYAMSGTNPNAFDLTTWEVQIRGNPVHLVIP
jgi:hypothetical protein